MQPSVRPRQLVCSEREREERKGFQFQIDDGQAQAHSREQSRGWLNHGRRDARHRALLEQCVVVLHGWNQKKKQASKQKKKNARRGEESSTNTNCTHGSGPGRVMQIRCSACTQVVGGLCFSSVRGAIGRRISRGAQVAGDRGARAGTVVCERERKEGEERTNGAQRQRRPRPAGQWERRKKQRERKGPRAPPVGSTKAAGKDRGRRRRRRKQREWKPWLSGLQRPSVRLCAALRCEAPCMVGDHQYPIRSVVAGLPSLPLAMAFSPPHPPNQEVPYLLPGPGRNQRTELKKKKESRSREGGRRSIDRLPSTKEAATMPPCRPLVAGRFLQSTYPSHRSASRAPSSCNFITTNKSMSNATRNS